MRRRRRLGGGGGCGGSASASASASASSGSSVGGASGSDGGASEHSNLFAPPSIDHESFDCGPADGEWSANEEDFLKGRARKIIGNVLQYFGQQTRLGQGTILRILGLSTLRKPALKYAVVKHSDNDVVAYEDARQTNVFFHINSFV